MKKLTDREVRRLLSARGTLDPPDDLAGRIKSEIPDVLHVDAAALGPERNRTMPPAAGLRSLWLIAVSLLVVIGAGFVVLRLLGPSEDLAQRIALEGVTVVKDVVVSVPERSTVERQKLASAMTAAESTKKGSGRRSRGAPGRQPKSSRQRPLESGHPRRRRRAIPSLRPGPALGPRSRWRRLFPGYGDRSACDRGSPRHATHGPPGGRRRQDGGGGRTGSSRLRKHHRCGEGLCRATGCRCLRAARRV